MKIGSYEVHEACQLFPLLDEEELEQLAEDIKENGLRHPIVLAEGKILDGRNRLLACERAGVEPRFEEAPAGDRVAYVLSTNLHRRHLSPSQAAMVAAKAVPMLAKEAHKRLKAGGSAGARAGHAKRGRRADRTSQPLANLPKAGGDDQIHARDEAAKIAGVSSRSVGSALKIRKNGAPEVIAAVERGEVSVSAAEAIVDRPAEEQREWLASEGSDAAAETRSASGRKSEDDVGSLMTRLRVTWRRITPERRRNLIQVLKVFLQMHEGKEDNA